VFEELVKLQLEEGTGALWSNAVHMCHTYFLEKGHEKPLPEEMTFELLTSDAMIETHAAHTAAYYWSRLSNAFLQRYPLRTWDFFERVLKIGAREWRVLNNLTHGGEKTLTEILQKDPEIAFACITEIYEEFGERNVYGLHSWLSKDRFGFDDEVPGPIHYV